MYLEHFGFTTYPFSILPDTHFYCALKNHEEAFNTLLFCLRSGEAFVKIVGEVGLGKTLLCRKLLNALGDDFFTVYVPNPDLTPDGIRKILALELGIFYEEMESSLLLPSIQEKLITLRRAGKNVVLVVDEAQALPSETLEAIRLLTNLETESFKLLQVVLLGQPELDKRLNQNNLRQLKQRIGFSFHLLPLTRNDIENYINHRLSRSGYTFAKLFTPQAFRRLHRASKGVPRVINILCHKALMYSYGRNQHKITETAIKRAIQDTEFLRKAKRLDRLVILASLTMIGLAFLLKHYLSPGLYF